MHCMRFNTILGFYSLDTNSISPSCNNQNYRDIVKYPLGGKITPFENHLSRERVDICLQVNLCNHLVEATPLPRTV